MSAVPRKRLLVYAVMGVAVLVAGVVAVVAMGEHATAPAGGLTIVDDGVETSTTAKLALPTTSTTPPTIFVQVAGAVRRPGVLPMTEGDRVFQAIEKAGGLTSDADAEAVALAAPLSDGCRVYVPRQGEVARGTTVPVSAGGGSPTGASGRGSAGPVSLNSATLEELDALPGIGPATAQKIIAYREQKGPFTSVDQLTEVPGIGPAKLEELRPLIEP